MLGILAPMNESTAPRSCPSDKIPEIQTALLQWFEENRRDLPWRGTRDPYRILISEVMLQQTQVDRVVSYYHAFLDRFPTVESLALAPTADVITLWAGLGYNRRAVNLQRTARYVHEECGGRFPETVVELVKLPGIGPYTAGAIAAFAFEQDVAFIDTNMRRVIHRLFLGPDFPALVASEKEILGLAGRLVPVGDGWRWNQALIEFGALQCTSRRPACVICPLQQSCEAFPSIQSVITALPKGSARKKEESFSGSNRYYRGRIVDALRDDAAADPNGPGVTLRTLGSLVRADFTDGDLPWLKGVVAGLERDGLAKVAEDPIHYSANPDPLGSVKVQLP